MKKILLIVAVCFISLPTFAADIINIQVKGMVCDFCAQSVWKVFKEYEGVKDISVDLDTQIVSIFMEDGTTLSDEKIQEGITYAGYDFIGVNKTEQ